LRLQERLSSTTLLTSATMSFQPDSLSYTVASMLGPLRFSLNAATATKSYPQPPLRLASLMSEMLCSPFELKSQIRQARVTKTKTKTPKNLFRKPSTQNQWGSISNAGSSIRSTLPKWSTAYPRKAPVFQKSGVIPRLAPTPPWAPSSCFVLRCARDGTVNRCLEA